MDAFRPTSLSSRRSASGVDKRQLHDVLIGNLTVPHSPLSRTIRLYVSSGWADCQLEKRHIFNHIIPNLYQFCRSLGLQFHAVDLFSVVPRHTRDTQGESHSPNSDNLHLNVDTVLYELEKQGALRAVSKEIELCQRVSPGPSFVTFLAQQYGYRALQSSIPEQDFTLLLAAVEETNSKKLIQTWYKLDTNAVPHEYILQSVSGEVSVNEWIDIHDTLSKTICRAAKVALGKDVSKVQHYTMSVVEEEVTAGIFNLKENPNLSCLWFKRTFSDLMEQRPSSDAALSAYTDLAVGKKGLEFDMEANKTLNHLKEARMPAKYVGLDSTNIAEYSLKWQKNKGLDPTENPTHSEYLTDLAASFKSSLEQMITDAADILEVESGSPVYQEVLCHGLYCKDRSKTFKDRPDITTQIYQYLTSPSTAPLVVHGETGSGKTSIMAGVACHIKEKYPLLKMTLVMRFIGITPGSSNIRSTLRSICEQISTVFSIDLSDVPGDYKSLTKHFEILLSKATKDSPLFLFLDGVDQLSPDDGALGMSWLPLSLPPNVKVVLSTSSEVQYRCYPVLQSLMSDRQHNFVMVSPLSDTDCKDFLRHLLSCQGRQLTPAQEETVHKACAQCPLPLYIQLLVIDLKEWHSYDQYPWENLPSDSLEGLAEAFLTVIEKQFGHYFTYLALGCITAAKTGLSEVELLEIMACDEELQLQLQPHWRCRYVEDEDTAPTFKVPPLLWSQFYHRLIPLLELRTGVGQTFVLQWSCRLLFETVTKRYLDPGSSATTKIFTKLADYFTGKHREEGPSEGSPPPVSSNQPILLNEEKNLWNVRKLTELPYCLARCGRIEELKKLLTDYGWLDACVKTLPCADIINWFSDVIPVVPLGRSDQFTVESDELRLLRDAIHLSVPVLNSDPTQLSSQLLSRLMPYITCGDSERRVLKQLVTAALEENPPIITPLQPSFALPGGPLLATMEGHRDTVSCIVTSLRRNAETNEHSLCILSSSWDRTLKTWDLKSTGVMKTFDGHTDRVLCVDLTCDALYAVSGSTDKTVRHWYVPTGECLNSMAGHTAAVNAVLVSKDGSKTVSAASDATVRVWNSDHTSSSYGQLIYTLKNRCSQVLSLCWCDDMNVAVGYKDGGVYIINIVSAETLKTFQSSGGGVSTLSYVELTSGCCYLTSGSESGTMVIRQMDSGDILHTIDLGSGPVRSTSAAPNGNVTAAHGDSTVSVWDLVSGSHMFDLATNQPSTVHSTSLTDGGALAITGSADNCIHIWDLASPPVSQTTKFHASDTLTVAVSPCASYAVSGGQDSTVNVYSLDTMTVLKQLIGHEGAVNDVVILRDSKHLLSGSADGSVRLWNGGTEELVCTYIDDKINSQVNCVAISADSELLMSGYENGLVAFWSVKTGKLLKTFANHKSAIVSAALAQSSTAKYIVSASRDGEVCVRDYQTAKIILSKQTHTDDLLCLAVSRDASVYVTGSKDKECHIVSLPDGSLKSVLNGHKGPVRSVRIICGGKMCLTASEDCTLRLWDVSLSECIATLHADLPILSCDIDRHEANILYGTQDGWVSSALYHDKSGGKENFVLRKLRGLESPSTSSLTETDSSQSSRVMNTDVDAKLQPDDVTTIIDASTIPLPPSDDELSTSLGGKSSTASHTSSLHQKEDTKQDETRLDKQKESLQRPPSTHSDDAEQAGTHSQPTNGTIHATHEKPSPGEDVFMEPDISAILKIKSELISGEHDGSQRNHEGTDATDYDKEKSNPPTSSTCVVL